MSLPGLDFGLKPKKRKNRLGHFSRDVASDFDSLSPVEARSVAIVVLRYCDFYDQSPTKYITQKKNHALLKISELPKDLLDELYELLK